MVFIGVSASTCSQLGNRIRKVMLAAFCLLGLTPAIAQTTGPYFQQHVSYDIAVTLNDVTHMLHGNLKCRYTNNSGDTLRFLYIHLWPNAYRDRETALARELLESGNTSFFFAPDSSRGFIDSLQFRVTSGSCRFVTDDTFSDYGRLEFSEPLRPGGTLEFSTPFRVKIPSAAYSRMGHIGQSYMISQWFPKPAVYDASGWHPMPYLDQGEFYSEFGTFRVAITLPANYRVAASGRLMDASEKSWLHGLAEQTRKADSLEFTSEFPVSDAQTKTITFEQDSIHDFAWFADKRFHVLQHHFVIPGAAKEVEAWSFFTGKHAGNWKHAGDIIEKAIVLFSDEIGTYPFASFTAVDGTIAAGGGMEYPMLTLMGPYDKLSEFENTLVHEIGHTWLYGILATNERDHPWMDEGINSFYEIVYNNHYYPGVQSQGRADLAGNGLFGKLAGTQSMNFREGFEAGYRLSAATNSDGPGTRAAPEYGVLEYGTVVYMKNALAFDFLRRWMGAERFRKCMRSYYDDWQFRHPQPADFRAVFEQQSGEDLTWFFEGILGTNEPMGYRITKLNRAENGLHVRIVNEGRFPVPYYLNADSASRFLNGFTGSKDTIIDIPPGNRIVINTFDRTLFKEKGYGMRTSGILKYFPEVRVTAIPRFTVPAGRYQINVLPVPAWNRYNQFMTGAWISGFSYIPQTFEYSLTPLYDWKNQTLAGTGNVVWHHWPLKGAIGNLNVGIAGRKFAFGVNEPSREGEADLFQYLKAEPYADVTFRNPDPRSYRVHRVGVRGIALWFDEIQYIRQGSGYLRNFTRSNDNFGQLSYNFRNNRKLDPFGLEVLVETGTGYLKSSLEFNYRFSYARLRKGTDIRFFFGGFVDENENVFRNYNFRMSGRDGSADYLYDGYYFGRTDNHGVWPQQFLVTEGGFKAPTILGQTGKWLSAINIQVDVPIPLPIRLFGDLGTYEGINSVFSDLHNRVMYDAGIALVPFKGFLEIYFPLFQSDDIERVWETNNVTFAEKIRFVFNIKALNPFQIRNSVLNNFR